MHNILNKISLTSRDLLIHRPYAEVFTYMFIPFPSPFSPAGGAGRIMFSVCPSVCACIAARARTEALSDRFAVDC